MLAYSKGIAPRELLGVSLAEYAQTYAAPVLEKLIELYETEQREQKKRR